MISLLVGKYTGTYIFNLFSGDLILTSADVNIVLLAVTFVVCW